MNIHARLLRDRLRHQILAPRRRKPGVVDIPVQRHRIVCVRLPCRKIPVRLHLSGCFRFRHISGSAGHNIPACTAQRRCYKRKKRYTRPLFFIFATHSNPPFFSVKSKIFLSLSYNISRHISSRKSRFPRSFASITHTKKHLPFPESASF